MRTKGLVVMMATLVLALSGCDGGDGGDGNGNGNGGSPGEVNFSQDDSATVNDIDSAQRDAMCETVKAEMAKAVTKEDVCTLAGLMVAAFAGGDPAACNQARTECINDASSGTELECEIEDDETQGCDATVGELEACINDLLPAMDAFYDSLSCDAGAQGMAEMEQPASCEALKAKCPNMFSADVSSDDSSGS